MVCMFGELSCILGKRYLPYAYIIAVSFSGLNSSWWKIVNKGRDGATVDLLLQTYSCYLKTELNDESVRPDFEISGPK